MGCDDNDDVVAPEESPILVIGDVFLRPYLDFSCSFHTVDGNAPDVNHVIFADSLCEIIKAYYFVYGNNYSYHAVYFNTADSNRYISGDTALVTFYEGPVDDMTITNVAVKLLDIDNDKPVFLIPEGDTTIDRGDSLNIVWQKVENADWYGVSIYYSWDSLMYHLSYVNFDATADTFYTINTDTLANDISINFHIMAVTGPLPGSNTVNVNGKRLYGSLYSSTNTDDYIRITVGDPIPLAKLKATEVEPIENNINEILSKIIKTKQ